MHSLRNQFTEKRMEWDKDRIRYKVRYRYPTTGSVCDVALRDFPNGTGYYEKTKY